MIAPLWALTWDADLTGSFASLHTADEGGEDYPSVQLWV
jgi:hypothetical protein